MVLLDGSCGSFLWKLADEKGIKNDPTWVYNIEHPELVEEAAKRYIDAGCDMIQTNTFAANKPSVSRRTKYDIKDIIEAACNIAAKVTDKYYLSSGPVSELLEPYGDLEEDECAEIYSGIFETAAANGAKAIMLETFMDVRMMEIAAKEAVKTGLPVCCSMTYEKSHRTIMGDTIDKVISTLEPIGISAVGMNCSYGPVEGIEVIKKYREKTNLPLYFKPNAGTGEHYDADVFVSEIKDALDFVSYIGGCCGTDDTYIRKLRELIG